jgi:hypothetical protein
MAKLSPYVDILDGERPRSMGGNSGLSLARLLRMTGNKWSWEAVLSPEDRRRLEQLGQKVSNPVVDFSHLKNHDRTTRLSIGYRIEYDDADAIALELFDR